MSRGGRRGYGRGGGGGGGGGRGSGRIAGADVPWAYDPDLKPDYKPSALFPPVTVPPPKPVMRQERLQVARYRSLRDRVHEGPLYTVLGDDSRVSKPGAPATSAMDPFEGMPTYSQKYRKKLRRVPRLNTRPYVLRFFPKELWSTLDPNHEIKDDRGASQRKKTLSIATSHALIGFNDGELAEGADAMESIEPGDRPLTKGDGEQDEDEAVVDDDGIDEEELDANYESDEDEMAGDYGAERYFDDGADDDVDPDAGEGNDGDVYN